MKAKIKILKPKNMHEIEVLLVSRWKELESELVDNFASEIEIYHYLLGGLYTDLPEDDEVIYRDFLDTWDEIRSFCNPEMGKNVETAFFVEWEPYDWQKQEWRRRRDELPLKKAVEANNPVGVWSLVTCSLNPESVKEIAKVTRNFNLDSYMVHFAQASPRSYLRDEQAFRTYSQIWLDYFNVAAANNAGIVILRK